MTREPRSILLTPPPLVFAAGLAAAWLLERARPLPIAGAGRSDAVETTASALLVLALALAAWGILTFARAAAPVVPVRPTPQLVTGGPFRFSRNPMYVAMTLTYAALSLLLDSWWAFAMLVPVLLVIRYRVIGLEERYLSSRFGPEYEDYRRRVRRWI